MPALRQQSFLLARQLRGCEAVCTFNRAVEIEANPLVLTLAIKWRIIIPVARIRERGDSLRGGVKRVLVIRSSELPAETAESDVAIKVIAEGLTLARFLLPSLSWNLIER